MLDSSSKTTIGCAASVCVTLISITAWLTNKLNTQTSEIATIRNDLALINARMGTFPTLDQESERVLRMALLNPGLKIPDPRNPSDIIVVDASPRKELGR